MPPQATGFGATKAKKRHENRRKNRPKNLVTDTNS
jgi:hypothetical protein